MLLQDFCIKYARLVGSPPNQTLFFLTSLWLIPVFFSEQKMGWIAATLQIEPAYLCKFSTLQSYLHLKGFYSGHIKVLLMHEFSDIAELKQQT